MSVCCCHRGVSECRPCEGEPQRGQGSAAEADAAGNQPHQEAAEGQEESQGYGFQRRRECDVYLDGLTSLERAGGFCRDKPWEGHRSGGAVLLAGRARASRNLYPSDPILPANYSTLNFHCSTPQSVMIL